LADYSGTFGTNQIIINTGGELLDSTAGNDFKVTTNNSIVELIYVDSAKGWLVKLNQAAGTTPDSVLTDGVYDTDQLHILATGGTVTESGDFKIHTFTGDGCFVVSFAGVGTCAAPSVVDYLVVAGGAGGGGSPGPTAAGGGGAGGFRYSASTFCAAGPGSPLANPTGITASATTYPVTVGAGGPGGPQGSNGTSGSNSVFSTITSAGGGAGTYGVGGSPGGSGGGSGNGNPGGTGNTPPVSPPQGNPSASSAPGSGSGGGGAIAAAGPSSACCGSPGGAGAGIPTAFGCNGVTNPSPDAYRYYAGGGGGNIVNGGAYTVGGGGIGGGGSGKEYTDSPAPSGVANTGGGGGGGHGGGAGGKGIVVIRYKFQ